MFRKFKRCTRRYFPLSVLWQTRYLFWMLLSAFLLSGLTANWYFCGLGCQQSTSVYYQCRFVDVSDNHQNPQSSYTNDGVTCEVSVDDWLCITESVAQMCSESNMNGTTCYYTFYEYPKTSVKIVKGPEKVNIPTDIFKVECQDSKRTEKKESISARIFQRSSLQDSNIISKTKTSNNALNVSVLAWDLGSMSSLEFSRLMPITSQYLETDLRAFTFQKYNSLDMTSVNSLFPILTGKTDKEWIDSRGQPLEKILDDLPFVWKTFAEHGYITAFADDTVLWTDKRVGQPEGLSFLEKPTHHYLGPLYSEMANDISRWNPFCLAGMATHKVLMNWVSQLFDSYHGRRKFAFIAHRELAESGKSHLVDADMKDFLQNLKDKGHLENTLLLIFSDSGARPWTLGSSQQAKLEENWPMLNIVLPRWVEFSYTDSTASLQVNTKRLITQLDIHATLLGVLDVAEWRVGHRNQKGISLFDEIPAHRTCADIGLPPSICLCLNDVEAITWSSPVTRAAAAVVELMNAKTDPYRAKCYKLKLESIKWARKRTLNSELLHRGEEPARRLFGSAQNVVEGEEEYYQLKIATTPGQRHYMATVRYIVSDDKFETELNKIVRADNPDDVDDECIFTDNFDLRDICFCEKM